MSLNASLKLIIVSIRFNDFDPRQARIYIDLYGKRRRTKLTLIGMKHQNYILISLSYGIDYVCSVHRWKFIA